MADAILTWLRSIPRTSVVMVTVCNGIYSKCVCVCVCVQKTNLDVYFLTFEAMNKTENKLPT